MKKLVVGDIHGCYGEFLNLLEKCGLSEDDEIIALGDIVDRGPDTPRLLEFFSSHQNVRSVMGNHERKHIRSYQGKVHPALSQMITRRELSEDGYRKMIDFIGNFPISIELDDALLIHGFYEPGLSLKEQKENVLIGTMSGETYFFTRYNIPWYQLYDGEKPVIAGHHDYSRSHKPMVIKDKVFLIDTGCCYGGALTGLILPDFRLVSVDCKQDYWSQIKKRYADIRFINKSDDFNCSFNNAILFSSGALVFATLSGNKDCAAFSSPVIVVSSELRELIIFLFFSMVFLNELF